MDFMRTYGTHVHIGLTAWATELPAKVGLPLVGDRRYGKAPAEQTEHVEGLTI